MIYNSNGNNTPYQSGGNAKVNKQLKELEEAIESVNTSFNNFLGKIDLYTGEDFIHGYSGANRFTDNTNRVKALEATVNGAQGTRSLNQKILDVDNRVTALGTSMSTESLTANSGIFHAIASGKYTFQNGYSVTGSVICRMIDGSVVYATDGINSVLIDYTSKDAWVAKAKVSGTNKFKLDNYGVLAFTESRSWSVYVIGNDFVTSGSLSGEYNEIITGVTIGGNLYAALGREYDFDAITTDTAGIRIATITGSLTAPNATITNLNATNETVADLTVTDEADINKLVNAKRNIQDEVHGKISVDSHPTNVKVYIGVRKFTGTYNLKLTHNVNGNIQTLFTATIVWNGKDPIVQYWEYKDNEPVDYLYSMVLTDDALYFVTQGAGNLYYSYDAMGTAYAPTSSEYPNIPYQPNDVRADYITQYETRTVFFGDSTEYSGVDILGKIKAALIDLDGVEYDDISVSGNTSLHNTTINGTLSQTGDANFSGVVTIGDLE
jgi:hypothetical protein